MRRLFLGWWPRKLGRWLTPLVLAILLYLPYEISNNLPQDSLASAPVSLFAVNHLSAVYTPVGVTVDSLLAVSTWVKDLVWDDDSYPVYDTSVDDVLIPASNGENSVHLPHILDDLWARSTLPRHSRVTLVVGNPSYDPAIGNHGTTPCVCSLLSVSTTQTEEQPTSETNGFAQDDSALDSNLDKLSTNFWQKTKLYFRQSTSRISGINVANQRHADNLPHCQCAPPTGVAAVEENHPSTDPRASCRHDRDLEDLDSTADDCDDRDNYDDWYDEDDEDEPILPEPRVHDCTIDDPNWTASFSILGLQARTCIPTYEPWQPQTSITTHAPDGCSYRDPKYRIMWSGSSTLSGCSREDEEWEPIHKDEVDEGSLVFGLHKFDPRNRGLDVKTEFRRCTKNKGRTLVIIGKTLLQFCEWDDSPVALTDDLNDSYRLASSTAPEAAQVIGASLTRFNLEPTATELDTTMVAERDATPVITSAPRLDESARPAIRPALPSTVNSSNANDSTPPVSKTVFRRLLSWFMSFSLKTLFMVLSSLFMVMGALWVPFYSSLYLQYICDLRRLFLRLRIQIGNSWMINAAVIVPVLYVIQSIPFLRKLLALYLEYKERSQIIDTDPLKSSLPSSKPLSATERKFNYRLGVRNPGRNATFPLYRMVRPVPSLALDALLSPPSGTEKAVSATESEMVSICGPSTPVPLQTVPVSTNETVLSAIGSQPASRSTSSGETNAVGVATPDYSAAESLLLLRTGSRGRSNLQQTPAHELSDVPDGSAEDRSTSTDGRDGTPLIPIPRRVRQKTPHHRVNVSEETSISSPEADVAFDDSTDGSDYEPSGIDTSNGSGSAEMDIVTKSSIDDSIDTSAEDMDLVTLSPRSPESEPSFGNLPWTSTPQVNGPAQRYSEQDLSPSTNALFCAPTASERRANSNRTDVAIPVGRVSVNPFIDTPDRQRGYGGLVVANERKVVSGPEPQPEKKSRSKPLVVAPLQAAGHSALTLEVNGNLESPASPAPEPLRPQALLFTGRSTSRVSPANRRRRPRGPALLRAFDSPEANVNPVPRQVAPTANVAPIRRQVRAPAPSTPLPVRGLERSLGSPVPRQLPLAAHVASIQGQVRAPAHSTPLSIRNPERSLGSSMPGTPPRPLPSPPSSNSPPTPWAREPWEALSASDRQFRLQNQTMFNDPTSPSPAERQTLSTPQREVFQEVIWGSEPRPARGQQLAGPEPLEDDGVFWNG